MLRPTQNFAKLVFAFVLLACSAVSFAGNEEGDSEVVRLESAFVYQFTKFLEWEKPGSGDFNVVVVGRDRFVVALSEYAKSGKKFLGRDLKVVHGADKLPKNSVQMVLVDSESSAEISKVVSDFSQSASVVITTKPGQTKHGALISFVKKEDSTIGFTLNAEVGKKHGITIGSQLRSLAQNEEGE